MAYNSKFVKEFRVFEVANRERLRKCSESLSRSENLLAQARAKIEQTHELIQQTSILKRASKRLRQSLTTQAINNLSGEGLLCSSLAAELRIPNAPREVLCEYPCTFLKKA